MAFHSLVAQVTKTYSELDSQSVRKNLHVRTKLEKHQNTNIHHKAIQPTPRNTKDIGKILSVSRKTKERKQIND